MKKRVFLQTCFFFNFVMFLGGGRRRRRGPSSLKTLKNSTIVSSRPAPLKGCGEFTGFASAADLKTVIGFLDSWMNSGFGVIEFEVPWSSLLESLVSFWRTLNWLWTSSCSLWGSFASLGSHLGCLGCSLDVPRCPLGAHWVHFNVF